jgi:pSer/pThr/pTyr-binding forkhead associated (FHA) protein
MAVKLTVVPPGESRAEFAYTFDQEKIVIGRGAGVDVRLPSPAVSEKHCVIRLEGQDYILFDPGSTNGTQHNGQALVEGRRKLLRAGDTIGVAGFAIGFRAGLAMEGVHNAERTAALAKRMVREALGAVGPGADPPRLTFLNGPRAGERVPIPESPQGLTIGRDLECEVRIDDSDASRRHARIRRTWDGVSVVDLGAKNDTFVNDVPLQGERRLRDRDELLLGATRVVFEDPAEVFLRELDLLERDAAVSEVVPVVVRASAPAPDPVASGPSGVEDGSAILVRRGQDVGSWSDVRRELESVGPAPAAEPSSTDRLAATDPIRTEPEGSRVADLFVVLLGIAILVGAVAALVIVLD